MQISSVQSNSSVQSLFGATQTSTKQVASGTSKTDSVHISEEARALYAQLAAKATEQTSSQGQQESTQAATQPKAEISFMSEAHAMNSAVEGDAQSDDASVAQRFREALDWSARAQAYGDLTEEEIERLIEEEVRKKQGEVAEKMSGASGAQDAEGEPSPVEKAQEESVRLGMKEESTSVAAGYDSMTAEQKRGPASFLDVFKTTAKYSSGMQEPE